MTALTTREKTILFISVAILVLLFLGSFIYRLINPRVYYGYVGGKKTYSQTSSSAAKKAESQNEREAKAFVRSYWENQTENPSEILGGMKIKEIRILTIEDLSSIEGEYPDTQTDLHAEQNKINRMKTQGLIYNGYLVYTELLNVDTGKSMNSILIIEQNKKGKWLASSLVWLIKFQ